MSGPLKPGHNFQRYTAITSARSMENPHPLSVHFTNFKQDFSNPREIPKDLLAENRARRDNRHMVYAGELPED